MVLQNIRAGFSAHANAQGTDPLTGAVAHELNFPIVMWSNGTGSYACDQVIRKEYSIAGSGAQTLDLNAVADCFGATQAMVEVVGFAVYNDPASSGNVKVSPNASNGWASLIDTAAASVILPPGAGFAAFAGVNGWAVGASNKVIDFDNAGASSSTIQVLVFARSS